MAKIKDRLKELDIKITELANYLALSRPTMYKFIEMYDSGNKKELTNSIYNLFDYIITNELIDKKNVINYILTNMVVLNDTENDSDNKLVKDVAHCLKSAADNQKKKIIEYITKTDDLDDLLYFIIDCSISSKKKKQSKKDETKTNQLKRINGIYENAIKEGK